MPQPSSMDECMNDSSMMSKHPDNDERKKICSMKMSKKEVSKSIFSKVHGFEVKENIDGDLIRGGYIATTHLDSGFLDNERGIHVKDKIAKETLNKWANEINSGNPRANKVSVNHDREPHVTGVGIKGTARVDRLPDGEYGLYVETLIDKTKETFNDVNYRLEKGLLDSFSIEFTTKDIATNEYLPNAVQEVTFGDMIMRTLLPGTQLEGWTLASQPMNEHAIMIKEVLNKSQSSILNKQYMEEKKMTEQVLAQPTIVEKKEISPDELSEFKQFQDMKNKSQKEAEMKQYMAELKEQLKTELKEIKIDSKVMQNPNSNIEIKEVTEFKEILKNANNYSIETQFKIAGKVADRIGLTTIGNIKMSSMPVEAKAVKGKLEFNTRKIGCNQVMEYKLGLTTNQNTDTDYLLSAAELSDVFDPVIFNALNQKTVTWNLLSKEDYSNKGNNQVQFALKTVANATTGAYLGNAVSTGSVTRQKYQTRFKKYAVGVEIDGDMIAAARGGPIGDVFANEVKDSTDDLMSDINSDLFAEVGLESAAGVIGFEYIADNAGNGTLYNVTRSSANKLSPASNGDTYINGSSADITLSNLRLMIEQAEIEGANLNNLVFITHPRQINKFKSKYDALQRLVPTSSRFGFEGRPDFDGVPIFSDK